MFRKLTIALGTTAVLAVAALTPTVASAAGGWHGGSHGGHFGHHRSHGWTRGFGVGVGFYGPTYSAGSDCYRIKRVVYTSYGPRLRRVTVCN